MEMVLKSTRLEMTERGRGESRGSGWSLGRTWGSPTPRGCGQEEGESQSLAEWLGESPPPKQVDRRLHEEDIPEEWSGWCLCHK